MKNLHYAYLIAGILILCIPLFITSPQLQAQTKAEIKQQAEAQLQHMTPDEIDAALKKYGFTRAEAEAKAKEYGIDLDTYLKSRATETTPPAQVNIKIEPVTPQQAPPSLTTPAAVTAASVAAPESIQTKPVEPPKPPKQVPPVMGPGEIPYFGYNLFKAGPSAFEPRPNLADNSYIVGEGDVLRIALWGDTQSMYEYTVDTEGRILIQPAGPVLVAGYTLDQVKTRVIRALSQSLSGLVAKPPTTFLDLTIARLRPVRAFIMGEVANPGTYSLSSFATVFNSLFTVGGPLVSGGMREVRLVRNGKTVAKIDLYDYLIGSEKTGDIRVNDNDIIYIPLRGRTVGIKGAVLRSAYFELLPNEQLKRLLDFSGGIRNTFYLQRIQVDRIVPFAERKKGEPDRKVFDIDFSEIFKSGKDYKLEDGDIVTVFPILEEKKNFVTLEGAVWRPGTYQLERISTVRDLIKAGDGLLPEAYLERANVIRTYDDKHTEEFFINIGQAMQGDTTSNLTLEPRDNICIFSRYEILAPLDSITVEGAAKRPGKYPLHTNLTLYDLVHDVVGLADTLFRKQVYLDRADLIRIDNDPFTSRIKPFNLWDLFSKRIGDTVLLPRDRIIIYPITAIEFKDRYVDISGRVKSPGRYKLSENMTVLDLLIQAGGYTEDAWPVKAELSRLERKGFGKDSLTHLLMVDVPDLFDTSKVSQEVLAEYRSKSLLLQHRDQVFIRPNPDYIFQQNVTVDGEVEHPGTYVISKLNEWLSDVIKRAGGVKKSGYPDGGKVIRGGAKLRIDVHEAIDDPEGDKDLKLQPGDIISIPSAPFVVQVSGEVNNPGFFSFVDGKKLSFYLDESGGETDSADFVLVTYPTGMVEQFGLHWWSENPKIPDGSSIFVVKEKPEPPPLPEKEGQKVTMYDVVKDMTAILVASLTIVVLAREANK